MMDEKKETEQLVKYFQKRNISPEESRLIMVLVLEAMSRVELNTD